MQTVTISISLFMLFFNAQLYSANPVFGETRTNDDMDILKVLLQRLGESIPEPKEITPYEANTPERMNFENVSINQSSDELRQKRNQAEEFLSAKDLKAVRGDKSSKKYSGCFGRKMDRIGTSTNLGCKTSSKHK